jgi:hypothetical protein
MNFRQIRLVWFACLTGITAFAQNGNALLYDSHYNLYASAFHPSQLGKTPYNFQMHIVGVYAWAATNMLTYKDLQAIGDGTLNNARMDEIVNNFPKTGRFTTGVYFPVPLLNLAVKVNREDENGEKKERFTFSVLTAFRAESGIRIGRELAEFAWRGNKQFVGQTVDVGKVYGNGFSQGEVGIGVAFPVFEDEKFNIRAGGRVKYILGFYNLYTQTASAKLTTTDNGTNSQVEGDVNYKANLGGFDGNDFDINGRGLGVDLGGTIAFANRFSATVSLLDLGAVRYKNARNYVLQNKVSFQGVNLNLQQDQSSLLDSLGKQFEGTETQNAYTAPLPTRLLLQGEYRIDAETRRGLTYAKHTFYLTYVQGLRNYGGAVSRPAITGAYALNLGRTYNVGSSFGVGGAGGVSWGVFTSVRAAGITLGFGTGNLLFLLNDRSGTDVAVNLGLNF